VGVGKLMQVKSSHQQKIKRYEKTVIYPAMPYGEH
jgi:hypothetical protein